MMEGVTLVLSVILFLFVIFIYLFREVRLSKTLRVLFCLGIFISLFFYVLYCIAYYFTGEGITLPVLYYMRYGLSGAGFLQYSKLIFFSFLFILFGGFLSFWLFYRKMHKMSKKDKKPIQVVLIFLLLLFSLLLNPVTLAMREVFFENNKEIEFDRNSEFYKYYKWPNITQVGEPKNLVFIYAEGLERTYFNESLFPGLTKNLKKIESESISFTDVHQDEYSHHTMGGIVASHCGFPLVSPSHANSMGGMDTYLESAVCLGDLLKNEGYYLSYYGGADLDFAGKGKFFSTHGFNEVVGREKLLPRLEDPDYKSGWGLYDDSLLDLAFDNFVKLSEKKDKFSMFLLTLDTHHPNGHPSSSCDNITYREGSNSMLDSVACSDYLISEFVEKIRQSEYSNKTVIVIASDHLALRNSATKLLEEGDRKNLFLINSPNSTEAIKISKPGLSMDIGPTVLPFIGYGGEIGLGRNLNKLEKESRTENFLGNLSNFEPYIMQFWNFPKLEHFIEINSRQKKLYIDDRVFAIPILIEFNDQLETELGFKIENMDKNKTYLIVDYCGKISKFFGDVKEYVGFCLLIGNAEQYEYQKLDSVLKLSKKEVEERLKLSKVELKKNDFLVERIAHAGGGVNGETYTNSIDALDSNFDRGFSYFEIDFSFTEDEYLVCLHDWGPNFKRRFGFETNRSLSLEEFNQVVKENSELAICTLSELIDWMNKNPDSYIITDLKSRNIPALEVISREVPNYGERFIPQIYFPENFDKVREMGYEQIIWTLYMWGGSNKDVLSNVEQFSGSFAIAMPKERANSSLPSQLAEKGIPTYVHTVNSEEEKDKFFKNNVSEIYTDFLIP